MLAPSCASVNDAPTRVEHAVEPTAEHLWRRSRARLRESPQRDDLRDVVRLGAAQASSTTTTFSLVVPNDFTREWIEGHFLGFVKAAARDALGRDVRVTLAVGAPASAPRSRPSHRRPRGERRSLPNPKYTFDSFVIGSSNRFAHAAALAVAEAPGTGLQPALHLRRHGPRQDAPPAGDRPVRRRRTRRV